MSGFSLHENKSKARWVEFPSKPNKNGEYEEVIAAYDSRQAKEFKAQVLKALDEHLRNQEAQTEKNSNTDSDSQQ